MFGIACLGAAVAGLYGIVHDQITFTISEEYFTRIKFGQFKWANMGLPTRVFVSEIGFLATWWVGFIAGWVLARVSAQVAEPSQMLSLAYRGFAIVVGCAFTAAVVAFIYGAGHEILPANSNLAAFADSIGVFDVRSFVRVAYIHDAGYCGGFLGILAAAGLLSRKARRPKEA